MPIDNYGLNSCSTESNDSSLYGNTNNSVYSVKDTKSGDFHLAPTDFSNFDQNDSSQMVPPTVRTNQCLSTRNSALSDKSQGFVSKCNNIELRVVRQPEEQHRARYMSEGSRGSVKDRSGKSFCTVSLVGYSRPTVLEIFASTAHGSVQPHPLYQVIGVTGKSGSATHCREFTSENGVNCLQVMLRPENNMTAILDCIGILKICSYNLKRKLSKQNRSSTVRLAFRASVPHPINKKQILNLQTVSSPIVCVQQLGYPDVTKISKRSALTKGGSEIFIIGKNFASNSVVYFREYDSSGCVVWSTEANVEKSTRHSCHLVCYTPPYRQLDISSPVEVYLTVECGSKVSRPISLSYIPNPTDLMKPIAPCVLSTSPNSPSPIFGDTLFSMESQPNLLSAEMPPIVNETNIVDVNVSPLDCQPNSFSSDIPLAVDPVPLSAVLEAPMDSRQTLLSAETVPPRQILRSAVIPGQAPTLELGYPGQLESIDAYIGINDEKFPTATPCEGVSKFFSEEKP